MMFERFTGNARHIVVQAQDDARRLGHNYIGCEHLLLAAAAANEPASAILRDHGVTPDRVEAEILRKIGRGYAADSGDPLEGLDHEALAVIGIDLDVVRARIEAAFGPDALALARAALARKRACDTRRRPAWRKGPVAELIRRRRFRRADHTAPSHLAHRTITPRLPGPAVRGHIPFTPLAKKSLELSRREALALKDDYVGVQHITLGLLTMKDGMVPVILSALGTSGASLRAAILERHRKAS
jgi:ATP-dependent Clp protease ATP-binding subunit ClpA